MAGGGGGGRELNQTPTWAVATVCAVIVLISFLLEKGIHHLGEFFEKRKKRSLFEALEKIKDELMILGFISLLLTFFQNYIVKICIPEKVADTMLPCRLEKHEEKIETGLRRLLSTAMLESNHERRILAGSSGGSSCASGKVPFVSTNGLHQLHIFIFFLAVFHVAFCGVIMALGKIKTKRWKEWEKEASSLQYELSNDSSKFRYTNETTFVMENTHRWSGNIFFLYFVSFFHQFFRSVRKTDYLTLRHGFIAAHLAPGLKFNFQKCIKRSLEDDFQVVVGISPLLWVTAVVVLLLNVNGWMELFWISFIPLITVLAVGTKLQAIIAQMAVEIRQKHTVIRGIPLVKPNDSLFWFGKPHLVLGLIHFILFQNAFQITYFVWIWYQFGFRSCFHAGSIGFIITRIGICVAVQVLCCYVTLPLYALVSQMGTHLKRSVFDEHTNRALKTWHKKAKHKQKDSSHTPSTTPPDASPETSVPASPAHEIYRITSSRHLSGNPGSVKRRQPSNFEVSESELEMLSPKPQFDAVIAQGTQNADVRLHVPESEIEEQEFSFVKPLNQGEQRLPSALKRKHLPKLELHATTELAKLTPKSNSTETSGTAENAEIQLCME